MDEGSGF